MIKRMVLRWEYENDVLDSSPEGFYDVNLSDPNNVVPTFDPDVPGAVGAYSAVFNGVDQQVRALVNPVHTPFDLGYTLTMWVKAATTNQPWHATMFNNDAPSDDFQIEINGSGQYLYYGSASGVFGPVSTEWVHLAVVCDGVDTTLYYNLRGDDAVVLTNVADNNFGSFQVGINRSQSTYFAGSIDDVKVWNYPRSYAELASDDDGPDPDPSDYYDVTGIGVCQQQPEMDLDDDCKVGLSDFAKLAESWLLCGLIPNTTCQ
jgi:hypothetical protein